MPTFAAVSWEMVWLWSPKTIAFICPHVTAVGEKPIVNRLMIQHLLWIALQTKHWRIRKKNTHFCPVFPWKDLTAYFKSFCWMVQLLVSMRLTLAWKIPWMEEPGRLQSMGSLRLGHDWATSLSLSTFMNWRRKWWPTPVFLPGESQGRRSLVGCRLWGRTESDTTEVT